MEMKTDFLDILCFLLDHTCLRDFNIEYLHIFLATDIDKKHQDSLHISSKSAAAVGERHGAVLGSEGGLRQLAAAGGLVVLRVEEVNTDGLLRVPSPGARPSPGGGASLQTHIEVILNENLKQE